MKALPDTSPDQQGETQDEKPNIDLQRLDAFGQSLARKRSEAIKARAASGIEQIWREDEEFYEGIDDANRGEERLTWRSKPPGMVDVSRSRNSETQSTLFMGITGPFVDAGSARISDMLFPTDEPSWSLDTTPIPDLIAASKGEYTPGMLRAANMQANGDPRRAAEMLAESQQNAQAELEEAKAKAKAASKRIEDWLEESQWHAQGRLVIEDAARVGTGVMKGPVPKVCRRVAWMPEDVEQQQPAQVHIKQTIKPESRRISYWDFYPDDTCGENIHNGSSIWERDQFSKRQVRALKNDPDCIPEQIEKVLREGPHKAKSEYEHVGEVSSELAATQTYEVWFFTGTAEKEDIEAAGCSCEDADDPHIDVHLMMINNSVVKVTKTLLEYSTFFYDVMVWQKRANHWTGIGLARRIRPAEKLLVAAVRHLSDNAGAAAGPMLLFREGIIYPADGNVCIKPRKAWRIPSTADESITPDKAIGYLKIDMMVNELMTIIELAIRFAELLSGMPLLMQGQPSTSMPDTLGGQQLFHENASVTARRLAKLFDDRINEPQLQRHYEWLLRYGDDPDEKGDFNINATGSPALVDRALQNQELVNLGMLVLDPRYGLDPERWAAEYLKSRKLDVKSFQYDDDERKDLMQKLAQGTEDNSVELAKIRDETQRWTKAIDVKLEQYKLASETDEAQKDRTLQVLLTTLEHELKSAEMAGQRVINTEKLKAALAQTTMRLNTQSRLAGMSSAQKAPEVATPAMEPPGRAPAGEAFQK